MIGRSKEVDRELSTVPTGSFNYVCVLGRYSTTRCSAGRITTAIDPQRLFWDAEAWVLGTGLFYLFAYYRTRVFFSPTLPGDPNCLLFKGTHLPSDKLATSPVRQCFMPRNIIYILLLK
ncbi:hypothetical protein AVEN_111738-1 [Araneus ventricosus]|uniref:Uncharacterized protein n=1 Tax=Araneus ventricosus TaxID=182803 RepID=A0A4Y2C8M6_ARAVE|nr:hypothetical protein AVEN_111738-1 [Araneus ventricosus]